MRNGGPTRSESSPQRRRNRRVGILVSVVLLVAIYSRIDLSALLATLSRISLPLAVVFVFLYALGQWMSAMKWRMLLRSAGIESSASDATRAYFFGMFVNSFGLGTVGGDVARSVAIRVADARRSTVLASTLADRLHGLMVLVAIGGTFALWVRPAALGPFARPGALLAIVAIATVWWGGPALLVRVIPTGHRLRIAMEEAAKAFPSGGSDLFAITAISVLFHALQIGIVIAIARSIGVDASVPFFFAAVPIVHIGASLPLSINGIGVREALYLFLFVPNGASTEECVAIGTVWILLVSVAGLLGGAAAARGIAIDWRSIR